MFTKFNVLSFVILFVINSIPIYFSHKRRRFAWYSSKIFIVLFSSYWVLMIYYFQSFGFFYPALNGEKPGNIKKPSSYETIYSIKSNYENETMAQLQRLHAIMKWSLIQAILVLFFAAFGILWLNEKVDYYTRIIVIFVFLLGFCIFISKEGLFKTGYEAIFR